MRLGQLLINLGVISRDSLERALSAQRDRGGQLGALLVADGACTQAQIDDAWVEHVVTPALHAAVDRASGHRAPLAARRVLVTRMDLKTVLVRRRREGEGQFENHTAAEGIASIVSGERELEVRFLYDPSTQAALMDDQTEKLVRTWCQDAGVGGAAGPRARSEPDQDDHQLAA